MKCPDSNSTLPEHAEFFNQCGHKLETACPRCGMTNPAASRYFME